MYYKGLIHKAQFDPFDPKKFTLLFEGHMVLISDNPCHVLYFGP